MIQKLKMTLLSFSALLMMGLPVLVAPSAGAISLRNNLCEGADFQLGNPSDGGDAGDCAEQNGSNLQALITRIINVISVIVGVIAVIMIIYGGFRYITSGGNDSSVSAAKNTILYALIGLIIVALAQVIVKFVLQNTPA